MIHTCLTPILLVALVPTICYAQPGPPDMFEREQFVAFERRMKAEPQRMEVGASWHDYKLVWVDHCNGGAPFVAQGDGTTLVDHLARRSTDRMSSATSMLNGPIFYGDRYAYMGVELPTGLVGYTHWYFERQIPGSSSMDTTAP